MNVLTSDRIDITYIIMTGGPTRSVAILKNHNFCVLIILSTYLLTFYRRIIIYFYFVLTSTTNHNMAGGS